MDPQELVNKTNAIARIVSAVKHWQDSGDHKFQYSLYGDDAKCWDIACEIAELLFDRDPKDAIDEIEMGGNDE